MIQRVQSIYLLLAAACCLAYTFIEVPWFQASGNVPGREEFNIRIDYTFTQFLYWNEGEIYKEKENTKMMLALLLTSVSAFIAIFLFKNRVMQTLVCYVTMLGLFGQLGILGYYWYISKNWLPINTVSSLQPWIALWFIPVIFVFLAIRGIQADEQLLRSADRLRE